MTAARVTTVVMTRDRWPDLERTLPRQTGPVVLVDNGSGDGTPRLVREHVPHVQVVELGRNHGAVARNVGVEAATTPYVAFADDDSWWAEGALDRGADLLDAHPRLALVAAAVLLGEGPQERLDPICEEMARSPLPAELDLPGVPVLGFVACASLVRREAFLAVGGFDEVVEFAGEEERVALDLAATGWGLAYVEDVVAHHQPSTIRETPPSRRTRIARNEVLTALMRRPWPQVARTDREVGARGDAERRGLAEAARRLRPALARRRVVPPHLETRLRLLETAGRRELTPGSA